MPTDAKGPYFVAEEDEFDFDLAAAIATESSKDESSQRLSDAVVNCLNAIDRVMGELQKTKEQPPNLLQFIDLLKKADNQIGVDRELVRIFQAQL